MITMSYVDFHGIYILYRAVIETQGLLFTFHDFERFIEIGPSPTLTSMATQMLKKKYEAGDDSVSRTHAILMSGKKNTKEVRLG